jgi:hypothetical protein
VTKQLPFRRTTAVQRRRQRKDAKEAKGIVLAELHVEWNAKYAARMANPKRRATRQAWWKLDRARRKPKPKTEAQRLRRNQLARARYARAKAIAVPPAPDEREAMQARWRRQKANQTRAQKDAANARRRARRALLPKKLRPRFDRPFVPRTPTSSPFAV